MTYFKKYLFPFSIYWEGLEWPAKSSEHPSPNLSALIILLNISTFNTKWNQVGIEFEFGAIRYKMIQDILLYQKAKK